MIDKICLDGHAWERQGARISSIGAMAAGLSGGM